MGRDSAVRSWLIVAGLLSASAVGAGLLEVRSQRQQLERLRQADAEDRETVSQGQKDWGGLAYYSLHLTYSEPSSFAFAALGSRGTLPWKHRVRMLALEGQIYESDVGNPAFALVGRFDFAFVASTILPLLVILLLHALRTEEREAGRFELLESMSSHPQSLWLIRAAVRLGALAVCLLTPLWLGALWERSSTALVAGASGAVVVHLLFWGVVCDGVGRRSRTSAVSLTILVGLWLALAVIAPALLRAGVEATTPLPEGGEILMAQRESVNGAWDLPKEATMSAFVATHPEWSDHTSIDRPFEWKWYYAFQQVGDQAASSLSTRRREGRRARDVRLGRLSWLSPSLSVERTLQRLAGTDLDAAMAYERSVREFHAALRRFYYPLLFEGQAFDPSRVRERPAFRPL